VQITGPADRPDLAIAKETCRRDVAENFREGRGVVIRHAKKAMAAAVAGKEKRRKRRAALEAVHLGQFDEVVVGGDLVAQLVLQSLAGASPGADRHRAGLGICA